MKQNKPIVSIICIAYNQEAYIKDALDGFVNQKTDFPFEVIIHDDASSDSTAAIIKSYQEKYPYIIKPIYERDNQFSQGNYNFINDMFEAVQGKYIATCEGDDYWIDPLKLQKQVDFLDTHENYSLCFHPVKITYEDGSQKDDIYPTQKDGFTLEKLVEGNFIQTNSVMYRATTYNDLPDDIMPLDWYLHLLHAKIGKIGFIDENMAVYRRHKGGVWWLGEDDEAEYKFLNTNYVPHQRFYEEASAMLDNPVYSRQMQHHAIALLERVLRLDTNKQRPLLQKIVTEAPETLHFALNGTSSLISELYRRNYDQSQALQRQQKMIEQLNENMHMIVNSRSFRIGSMIMKPMRVAKNLITKR